MEANVLPQQLSRVTFVKLTGFVEISNCVYSHEEKHGYK